MSFDNENKSYNRYNNDGEQRPQRARVGSYNREGGERPYRSSYNSRGANNGERPQRPRFNPNREGGFNREGGYSTDRPQRPRFNSNREGGFNREGGYSSDRPQRPRFNSNREGGFNREGGYSSDRPQRPRFNSNREGGFNREGGYSSDRPQRPRFNSNREGGFNREGGYSSDRPQRPRFNSNREGGFNREGGYSTDRPQRPRFQGGQQPRNARPQRPRTGDYNPNAKYSMKKQIEYKDILTDPNEPIRLNKYLANAGVCSRREADEFITAGVVSVNGEIVTELGTKIKRTDEVKFHDEPVSVERKVYVLLNKPKDCVTTSDDPQERKTVMHCVKDACKERIYPVGRLDRNTTGVLLLTNDGDMASKLTHPKFLKKKIYHVYCDKNVTKADLDQIAAGITLDDGEIHADAISYASETDKKQVGIEIHSGKNRIVRRIFESLGYKVVKLDRVYFAGLTKKGLKRGDWRFLTEMEVNMLRMGSFE